VVDLDYLELEVIYLSMRDDLTNEQSRPGSEKSNVISRMTFFHILDSTWKSRVGGLTDNYPLTNIFDIKSH